MLTFLLIQKLLNQDRPVPLRLIAESGVATEELFDAIEDFQRRSMHRTRPDGRVDPGQETFRALYRLSPGAPKTLADGLELNGVRNATAQANAGAVLQALKDKGIASKRAQANILAQVNAECRFVPCTEGDYSAATLLQLYGPQQTKNKVRFQTLEDAQAVVKEGHVAVFDKIYGGRMGNNTAGDGYKYRGRGYIQLTGKENYSHVGAAIGENLVGNPDLANDPKVATKILLNFLQVTPANQANLEDINWVNDKVGPADSPLKRAIFAEAILPFI